MSWTRKDEGAKKHGWLGIVTRPLGRAVAVVGVRSDGPAGAAGIYPGDEIVAVGGNRADEKTLAERLAEKPPGSNVRLALFRRDELIEVTVTLAEPPPNAAAIVRLKDAPRAAAALGDAWLSPFER